MRICADNDGMNMLHAPTFPGLAVCIGYQEDGQGGGFWLYNLLRDIPAHPAFSTVSEQTLTAHASKTEV